MKTSLRKLVAMICVLAIAAVLPVMASAEGGPAVTFTTDKTTVEAGDVVTLSVNVTDLAGDYWSLLQFEVGYDETQLEPQLQYDEIAEADVECLPGEALTTVNTVYTATFWQLNDDNTYGDVVNPIQGGIVSTVKQKKDGCVMTMQLKVKEGVEAGEAIVLNTKLVQLGQKDGASDTVNIADPTTGTVTMTVAGAAPITTTTTKGDDTTTTKGDDTTATTKGDDTTTTKGDDTTATTKGDDTTAADDTTTTVDVADDTTTTVADNSDDVATGETATMIVLALVLLAGSAVALISMKKKALSK